MEIRLFVLAPLIVVSTILCASDYASWAQQTSENNTITHVRIKEGYTTGIVCSGVYKNYLSQGQKVHIVTNMTEWYFYKNHVIGKFMDASKVNFFIFDESNCQHEVYTNEKEFTTQLKQKGLKPLLWTRWYKETYGVIFIDSGNIGDMLAYSFFKLPLLILFTLFFSITLFRTKFEMNKRVNKINLTITAVLLLRIFLDFHPSSF